MVQIETHIVTDQIPHLKLNKSEQLDLYKDMFNINMMERYLDQEYAKGNVRGFCHLVIGQEGLYAVLKKVIKNDLLISSYRCHGAGYAAGISIKEIICENLGTTDGNCKGKGGSMHLYNDKFFGGHGIVGAQVPLGAGLAFALKYKNFQKIKSKITSEHGRSEFISSESTGVSFAIYGDGASNQGQIFETFNMAKVYNLPIVFIVENNMFGMYTPVESVSVDTCFFKRGYGIPGLRTSDSDVEAVYSAISYAKDYAMSKGPIIVQIDTERTCGHSTLDTDQFYREKAKCFKYDCLTNLEIKIGECESSEIKKDMQAEFNALVSSINTQAMPSSEQLYTDVFY